LVGDLGVALLQLNQVLLELVVAEQRVVIVRRVVDDSATELSGGSDNAQSQLEDANQNLFFHRTVLLPPSQIRRHLVVVVIGQCEIAREIDFDSVAFTDGHRGHDVQELV
jgi:hypothetical protein